MDPTVRVDTFNSLGLKYQRFTWSGFKDIGIRKFNFVAKTQFLSQKYENYNFKIFLSRYIKSLCMCIYINKGKAPIESSMESSFIWEPGQGCI